MKKLPHPIDSILDARADQGALHRAWRGVQARRARPARSVARWAVPVAAGALVVLVALGIWLRGPAAPPGPLAVEGGDPLATLLGSRDVARPFTLRLSDRSRLELSPGARLEVAENAGDRLALLLAGGSVRFAVTPGGPRRWTIHAGPVSVEVVGTRFTVTRSPEAVSVEVREGTVRVTSELLSPAVRLLHAGDRIRVATPMVAAAPVNGPAPAHRPDLPIGEPPPPAEVGTPSHAPTAPRDAWRAAEESGDHARAYAILGPGGIRREAATSDDAGALMALADVARLSGHAREAIEPLRRVTREHAGDRRAGLAAFTLGRVELGELGDASTAATSFELALRLGIPGGLQELAHARLVEAHARAGHGADAARWAQQYRARFPEGRHAAEVDRWVPASP